MANSADTGQLATDLDLHCLQRQDISGFSRTRVNIPKMSITNYPSDYRLIRYKIRVPVDSLAEMHSSQHYIFTCKFFQNGSNKTQKTFCAVTDNFTHHPSPSTFFMF